MQPDLTARTNELLQGASAQTGIPAPTFPVSTPTPEVAPTVAPTTIGGTVSGPEFSTPKTDTVKSPTLMGGQTTTDILKKRDELLNQFLTASKPTELETSLTGQINEQKQLSRKAQLEYMDESRRLQEQTGLTKEQSQSFISETGRRFQDAFARQGIGMSGLSDALNAEVGKRKVTVDGITAQMQFSKDNVDLLKDLQAMTNPNIIGSPSVNEATGDVTIFQQNPSTGEITSKSLGNVGASKKFIQSGTYQDAQGNQQFWGLTPQGTITTQSIGGAAPGNSSRLVPAPGGGMVSGNALALAQVYASSGTLPNPTDLKSAGTTFEEVTRLAQELPKPAGSIVDKNTGVKPKTISSTQEDGIVALKDLTQKLDDLKSLYGKTNLLSKDAQRQQYVNKVSEITDLLARARTGAAITEFEQTEYAKKMPKLFGAGWLDPRGVFFGASRPSIGNQKIDDLKSSLGGKLDTILNTQGVSIVGYSKVKVGGEEFTVGDVIDNGAGQRGRVNANGTITIEGGDEVSVKGARYSDEIASAIRTVESGGNYGAKGASGENGAYQFMPATWKEWAGQYLGNPNAPMTQQNQDKVAVSKIEDLLKQGYNDEQIALIWNGGTPNAKKGVNSKGVAYDSGAYAKKVLKAING